MNVKPSYSSSDSLTVNKAGSYQCCATVKDKAGWSGSSVCQNINVT